MFFTLIWWLLIAKISAAVLLFIEGITLAKKLHSCLQKFDLIKLFSEISYHTLWYIFQLLNLVVQMLVLVTLAWVKTVWAQKLLTWYTVDYTVFVWEAFMFWLTWAVLLIFGRFIWASKTHVACNLIRKEVFNHIKSWPLLFFGHNMIFCLGIFLSWWFPFLSLRAT